jgi:hypothetical protein
MGSALAALVTAAVLTGCDPCTGILECATPARISVSGRIIEYPSGKGVFGVEVTVEAAGERVAVVTDRDGFWTGAIDGASATTAEVTGRITVYAPHHNARYTVPEVPLRVTTRRGDGVDVGRWYALPWIRFTGELRPQPGLSVEGATVTVDRLAGEQGPITGLVGGVYQNLFYVEAPALGLGEMTVRLRVSGPGLPRTYSQDSVRIRAMYRDLLPPVQGVYFVGNALPYVARIERRGTRTPWGGIPVTFRRTGGVRTASAAISSVSTPEGLVPLRLDPLEQGTVIGDLEIRPPAPFPVEVVRNIALSTVDDDVLRFAGAYAAGPWLPYVVRLYRRGLGTPLGGVRATFRRKSGVATAVDTLSMLSTPDGLVSLQLPPAGIGELTGDLELVPPAPLAPVTIPNLKLVTLLSDSLRQLANIGVGPALPYVLRLFRRGADVPYADIPAIFRRTGGVATLTDSLVTRSTADGLVSLQLMPASNGTVIGDLELRPPAPAAPTVLRGITLTTVESDSLRLAGNRGVGAQLRYAIRLYERTSFAAAPAGISVEFRPIGGALSRVVAQQTMSEGIVGVTAPVDSAGAVEGDLLIRWAPPRAPEVRRLRFTAYEDDSVRFGGYFGAGPSLLYVGAVEDSVTRQPITGGTAEFRRTGGILVREPLFTWGITPLGLFRVAPTPLDDGEVIGDLTLRLPPPYRDTTFTGVRLSTFSSDDTRPAPTFRVVRP